MAARAAPIVQECVEAYLFAGRPPRLLLFRRPPSRGGFWVPVSGKVETADRDYSQALVRELREETGFIDPVRSFPLDWEVTFDGPDGRPWRLHAFGVEIDGERTPSLSTEHDRFEWVGPEEARTRLHYPDNQRAVDRLLGILARERLSS